MPSPTDCILDCLAAHWLTLISKHYNTEPRKLVNPHLPPSWNMEHLEHLSRHIKPSYDLWSGIRGCLQRCLAQTPRPDVVHSS